jgi:SAM-dependent methyltransferase
MTATESASAWSAVASGWERRDRFISEGARPVTDRLLTELDPRPGQEILEVGGGLGEVGRRAAELVRPGGRVLVIDQSPAMVEAARRLGAQHDNLEVRVLDAQALDLDSASVDGVVSRFAYMLVPDPVAALTEARRVLRPGGRLALAVWAAPEENPWGSTIGRSLVELGIVERPEPDTPGPFRLADPARLESLVRGAGFAEPTVAGVDVTMRYASFDEYWDVTRDLSMSLREALARVPESAAAELRSRVDESLAQYAGDEGLAIPGRAWVTSATAR